MRDVSASSLDSGPPRTPPANSGRRGLGPGSAARTSVREPATMGAPPMPVIDVNADLGESYGSFVVGRDEELIPLLTSAQLACGFHGGDPRGMDRPVRACRDAGVAVGAHPGFPDLVGFGRRVLDATAGEAETDVLYQVAALDG